MAEQPVKPDDYSDIIDLPHHRSARHAPMERSKRAAQFAPFAALSGYEEVIAAAIKRHEQQTTGDTD